MNKLKDGIGEIKISDLVEKLVSDGKIESSNSKYFGKLCGYKCHSCEGVKQIRQLAKYWECPRCNNVNEFNTTRIKELV